MPHEPDSDDEVSELLAAAAQDVAEHGYHLTYVFRDNDDPPFCYSAGLWQSWTHPELLLYGLGWDDAVTVVGGLAKEIRGGRAFTPGHVDSETFNRPLAFLEVPAERYEGRIPITIMYYRGFDFPVLQVVTPDEHSRFPWDTGCERATIAAQPIVGTWPNEVG